MATSAEWAVCHPSFTILGMIQLGLIGDIHTDFDAFDVTSLNASDYDYLLCTGDLGHYKEREGLDSAEMVAQLQKPTFLVFGNHDTVPLPQLLAEIKGPALLRRATAHGHVERIANWTRALGSVQVGGYTSHLLTAETSAITLITGRPLTFGGPRLSCAHALSEVYGVASLADSAEKMKQLVDSAETDDLIFLSHNGPTGLGDTPDAIWGCDFSDEWGDFGDPDLREAIDYAQESGKRVRAVIGGHMHHDWRTGGERQWLVEQDGIAYINAARVPRIFEQDSQLAHHHVRLVIDAETVQVSAEVWCSPLSPSSST